MSLVLNSLSVFVVILEVLLIFNLVIIVHELGHFLAARWRGLVVEEFGVWFGKPLWRKKIGGVWYSLGSIPAGGFVKLPQMAPMEIIEGESDAPREAMPNIGPLNKIITAFAGPFFSLLLALALGTVTWLVGTPTSQPDNTTEIGVVSPGGPAERAGLKMGDKILEIDGKPVTRFSGPTDSVIWGIMSSQGEKIHFLVERDGKRLEIDSTFEREETGPLRRKAPRKVQLGPREIPEVRDVLSNSDAAKAGLRALDIVQTANGLPIYSLGQIVDIIKKDRSAPLHLVVKRGAETAEVTLPPVPPSAKPEEDDLLPGVSWGRLIFEHPTPLRQVSNSVKSMRNMIGAVLSPKGDISPNQFSGPIGIMSLYYRIFRHPDGWRLAISFSVFFNVNLALINMLPFPVLDGGHITLAAIEAVRRRPVNARALEILQTACALLLVSFIAYVSFFDVGDHVPKAEKPKPAAPAKPVVIEAAPPAETPAPPAAKP